MYMLTLYTQLKNSLYTYIFIYFVLFFGGVTSEIKEINDLSHHSRI